MSCYKIIIFLMVLMLGLTACLVDEDLKINETEYTPEQLDDGWEISSPEAEGFDRNKLDMVFEKFFSESYFPTAHALLIIRNGKLLAEAYCRDMGDRDRTHPLQSATKSITSLLLGIASDKQLLASVHQPVYQFLPEYFDDDIQKRDITIFHTLTMQTGLDFNNDVNTIELYNYEGNSLEYVLGRDLVVTPGTVFYYNDGNPQLISGIIQKFSGLTLEEFARENLFGALGISDFRWEKSQDGRNFGAFGLWLKPRDMAKIGKLVVQNGFWLGNQVVSSTWLDESTTIYANTDYGYYWWIFQENNVFAAKGDGEQMIYMVKDKNLVIVLTGDPYSRAWALSPGLGALINDIVAAMVN